MLLLLATLAPEEAHAVVSGSEAAKGPEPADRWPGDTFDVELLERVAPDSSPLALVAPAPPADFAPPAPPKALVPAAAPQPPASPATPAVATASAPEVPRSAIDALALAATEASSADGEPAPTASAGVAPATTAARAPAEGEVRAAGTAFGAPGPGGAVRQLGRAFTRSLPAAALPKDGWLTLPVGASSEVRVTLTVDASGQLLRPAFGEDPVPRYLRELVRRAHLLLERGRFSIGEAPGAGRETFAITVEVRDEMPSDDPFVEPGHIIQRGFEPPAPDAPGRAYFTFASGRHIEVHVALVP